MINMYILFLWVSKLIEIRKPLLMKRFVEFKVKNKKAIVEFTAWQYALISINLSPIGYFNEYLMICQGIALIFSVLIFNSEFNGKESADFFKKVLFNTIRSKMA